MTPAPSLVYTLLCLQVNGVLGSVDALTQVVNSTDIILTASPPALPAGKWLVGINVAGFGDAAPPMQDTSITMFTG